MKTSSIAVETSRSTTQSDSIVRQTNKRSSYLSYTTMNNKHIFNGGFYRKGPAVRRRLDRPSWTGQTSGGFLDFMHFFIAYQGTT